MYERCLNEAERMLATSKEVVLPIKQVWKQLVDDGKRRAFDVPALTDFDALLEGDKRFEIISAQTDPDELESLLSEDGEEIDANLGTLGFYPEDRVKLRKTKLPTRSPGGEGTMRENEEDEEVVPLNVKGLSTTRLVRPVEIKKLNPKRVSGKVTGTAKVSSKTRSRKRSKPKSKSRMQSGKTGHKAR